MLEPKIGLDNKRRHRPNRIRRRIVGVEVWIDDEDTSITGRAIARGTCGGEGRAASRVVDAAQLLGAGKPAPSPLRSGARLMATAIQVPGMSMVAPHRRGSLHAQVDAVLRRLRDQGRRAVRIADLDCHSGRRLVRIARRARALGFVAIEARGCARTRDEASAAARAWQPDREPAIGVAFDATASASALSEETADGADLVILPNGGLAGLALRDVGARSAREMADA